MSAATSVDLPDPGGPVIPTRWARPASGYSRRRAASATGGPVLDRGQQSRERPPVARERGVGQSGRPAPSASADHR